MIERRRARHACLGATALLLSACSLDTHATGAREASEDIRSDAAVDQSTDAPPIDKMVGDAGFDAALEHADAAVLLDASPEAGPEVDAALDASFVVGEEGYPELLSETGLYQDVALNLVHSDVTPFEPRFALWSDGAHKQRWLALPRGSQINTDDMDAWVFPVGTKAWKEFRVNGVRVETRMLHKLESTRWVMIAYRWRADQSDADALPEGEADALGTPHDVPGQPLCVRCHGETGDTLLGVGALQLSHDRAGINLMQLGEAGRLTKKAAANFRIPGGTLAENALGYLHANCGHCHREGTTAFAQVLKRPPRTGGPILWERTDALDTLEHTVGYASTVLQPNSVLPDFHIIEPGAPDRSELVVRASERGLGTLQMPPVGTEVVDPVGLKQVRDWIYSLKK